MRTLVSTVFLSAAMLSGGCQAMAAPAVLTSGDAAAVDRLKAALGKAMGRTRIDLGPGDPTQTSTIAVLPLPLIPQDDRSLALPTIFRLEIENGACVLVREDTGMRYPAEGVDCKAAK
jgi:hypothetical protein